MTEARAYLPSMGKGPRSGAQLWGAQPGGKAESLVVHRGMTLQQDFSCKQVTPTTRTWDGRARLRIDCHFY
jgi:hypothetical protein